MRWMSISLDRREWVSEWMNLHRFVFGISGNFRRRRSTCPGMHELDSARTNWLFVVLAVTSSPVISVCEPSPMASSSALGMVCNSFSCGYVGCVACAVSIVIDDGPFSSSGVPPLFGDGESSSSKFGTILQRERKRRKLMSIDHRSGTTTQGFESQGIHGLTCVSCGHPFDTFKHNSLELYCFFSEKSKTISIESFNRKISTKQRTLFSVYCFPCFAFARNLFIAQASEDSKLAHLCNTKSICEEEEEVEENSFFFEEVVSWISIEHKNTYE